jgi:hypothetical protein
MSGSAIARPVLNPRPDRERAGGIARSLIVCQAALNPPPFRERIGEGRCALAASASLNSGKRSESYWRSRTRAAFGPSPSSLRSCPLPDGERAGGIARSIISRLSLATFVAGSASLAGRKRADGIRVSGLLQRGADAREDGFELAEDLMIPEAHHTVTFASEVGVAFAIGIAIEMLRAVELDDQLALQRGEISDKGSDWNLPAKLDPVDSASAQQVPQLAFDFGLRAAQPARTILRRYRGRHWKQSCAIARTDFHRFPDPVVIPIPLPFRERFGEGRCALAASASQNSGKRSELYWRSRTRAPGGPSPWSLRSRPLPDGERAGRIARSLIVRHLALNLLPDGERAGGIARSLIVRHRALNLLPDGERAGRIARSLIVRHRALNFLPDRERAGRRARGAESETIARPEKSSRRKIDETIRRVRARG